MRAEIVRVYHQSLWFWVRRIIFFLLASSVCACASQAQNGGIFVSLFMIPLVAISSFGLFALEPLAVEIYPDFFALRFLWKRQKYPFTDVNYITRDEVSLTRDGTVQTVKVGFRSGHPLQLQFPAAREKLYHALITAWHAASS